TKIMNPSPKYNITGPYLDVLPSTSSTSSSTSLSTSPLKIVSLDAMKVGTATQAMDGIRTCLIRESVVTLSPIQSMVVVTSPIGDQAPPAFAAITTIPANQ